HEFPESRRSVSRSIDEAEREDRGVSGSRGATVKGAICSGGTVGTPVANGATVGGAPDEDPREATSVLSVSDRSMPAVKRSRAAAIAARKCGGKAGRGTVEAPSALI